MPFAILYLGAYRRLKIFLEGGYHREERIAGIGWCVANDDVVWADEMTAIANLGNVCTKIKLNSL